MDDYLMPGIPRNIAENPDMETVELIRASITEDSCQVVDSDMLLPCPFCGGEAIQVSGEYRDGGHQEYTSYVKCECCGSVSQRITESCSLPEVEKIAAYAWNRRSERTCHDETESQQSFLCSECGWFWIDLEDELVFSYCPNCGAKVVDE